MLCVVARAPVLLVFLARALVVLKVAVLTVCVRACVDACVLGNTCDHYLAVVGVCVSHMF